MRIASSTIYTDSVYNINNRTADLAKLQNQLSTGRKILTPADDPVASARSLDLTQASSQNSQYITNIGAGSSSLSLSESSMQAVVTTIQDIQQLAVQSGNPALTSSEKNILDADLKGKYQQMLGLANATDGNGQYLFSGFKGSTKPFNELSFGNIRYDGDQGQRKVQIAASRQIPISDSGADIFVKIKDGNSVFTTAMGTNNGGPNTGTGVISPGVVADPVKWANPTNTDRYSVKFHVVPDPADASKTLTSYDIIDSDPKSANYNKSLIDSYDYTNDIPAGGRTDTAATPNTYPRVYSSGSDIVLKGLPGELTPLNANWDFGASVSVSGVPNDQDSFTTESSKSVDLFTTIGDFSKALTDYADNSTSRATFQNQLNTALSNLNNALGNVVTKQANIGSRLNEMDSINSTSTDLNVQYQQTISDLTGLDYVKGISDFTSTQTYLDAARKAFSSVQDLSLFKYIQ